MKTSTKILGDEPVPVCPYGDGPCAEHMVHIESVKVNRGGEITAITCEGTEVFRGEAVGRGAEIEIVYWCEAHHKWKVTQRFHKGLVFIDTILLVNAPESLLEGRVTVEDLWRD